MSDYELQQRIVELMDQRPELRRQLQEAVGFEEALESRRGAAARQPEDLTANPPVMRPYVPPGWQPAEVRLTNYRILSELTDAGIIDFQADQSSRTYKFYRLHSRADTVAALGAGHASEVAPTAPSLDALFHGIIGHDRAKRGLLRALSARAAVHILLIGPPGTAKTLMLDDIAALPGGALYQASSVSRSGLTGLLIEKRPKYLCLDELEWMKTEDLTALLNLMASGRVTRLQNRARNNVYVTMDTRVFASANDVSKLERAMPALLSRFGRLPAPGYSREEFIHVATEVLRSREGYDIYPSSVAQAIAAKVSRYSLDVRDAVRVARMVEGDPGAIVEVVEALLVR